MELEGANKEVALLLVPLWASLEALASLISVILRQMGGFLCLEALRTSRQGQCVHISLGLPSMVMGLNAWQMREVVAWPCVEIFGSKLLVTCTHLPKY